MCGLCLKFSLLATYRKALVGGVGEVFYCIYCRSVSKQNINDEDTASMLIKHSRTVGKQGQGFGGIPTQNQKLCTQACFERSFEPELVHK